ncbi:MAG: hypothetical protein ABI145_10325 [Steroidobacteraceae bacterium]
MAAVKPHFGTNGSRRNCKFPWSTPIASLPPFFRPQMWRQADFHHGHRNCATAIRAGNFSPKQVCRHLWASSWNRECRSPLKRCFRTGKSTQTAGSNPKPIIKMLQVAGYFVVLLFVGLSSAQLSVLRVETRKEQGGHGVPLNKLNTRFPRTQRAVGFAAPMADMTLMFDRIR